MLEEPFDIEIEDANGVPGTQPFLDDIGSEDEFEALSDIDWEEGAGDHRLLEQSDESYHISEIPSSSSSKPKPAASNKRRKPKRRRREIEPNDIRLQYLDDHVAAINSADSDRLWSLLQSRYTPDCLHIERYLDAVSDPDICMYREMHGWEEIHKFISATWEAVPDITMKLIHRRLHIRSNERSYIIGAVQFTGSWIYKINTQNYEKESKHLLSRYNPFTRLYNFMIGGGDDGDATPSPPTAARKSASLQNQQQQEERSGAAVSITNNKALPPSSLSFPATKAVAAKTNSSSFKNSGLLPQFIRGKSNSALTTIQVSQDSIKVSTPKTAFDTSTKKDHPVKLEIFYTMIMFLNEEKLVYRFEHIKRAKTTVIDLNAYLSGTFEDEDIGTWKV